MANIFDYISSLNNLLEKDARVIKLNESETKMTNSKEVILLSRKKEEKEIAYSDLLNIYDENDEVVVLARRELYLAKKEMDEHPLVREYLNRYKEVKELYEKVSNIIFGDFLSKTL